MQRSTITTPFRGQPRIRRGYFECRFGQLHVYNAIPPGGGFDEGTALLLLHHSAMSGAAFDRVLPLLGQDRSVYAPDLPGCGASDPPAEAPAMADYVGALEDFLDAMRLRQVDVVGYQSGALVALALAVARPMSVRRLACVSVPLANDAARGSFERAPWATPPVENGDHLNAEWERTRGSQQRPLALDARARVFWEGLRNGPRASWAMRAALEFPARAELARVAQPLLLVRVADEYASATLEARQVRRDAEWADLADVGSEAFERAPALLAQTLHRFLGAG